MRKKIIISISAIVLVLAIILGLNYFNNEKILSKEDIIPIVLKSSHLNLNEVYFKEIELDTDNETKVYEVEFYYNKRKYKCEVDAKTGEMLYNNYYPWEDVVNDQIEETNTPEPENTPKPNYIGREEAKNIALTDAGLTENDVFFIDVELEIENGKTFYEVDFDNNRLEYDYKIDAFDKTILSKKQEPRD